MDKKIYAVYNELNCAILITCFASEIYKLNAPFKNFRYFTIYYSLLHPVCIR